MDLVGIKINEIIDFYKKVFETAKELGTRYGKLKETKPILKKINAEKLKTTPPVYLKKQLNENIPKAMEIFVASLEKETSDEVIEAIKESFNRLPYKNKFLVALSLSTMANNFLENKDNLRTKTLNDMMVIMKNHHTNN
ncbi:MAG: hypothetical protein ACTSXQ_01010 [Alphaproteobacteria bacterium]